MQTQSYYERNKDKWIGYKAKNKEWRRANRERLTAYNRQYVLARKERFAALHREWVARNPERRLLAAAKKAAKSIGVPFDLELLDIVIPECCPVLGIPLARGRGTRTANSPSLDRIVPFLGYIKSNVIVVSWRANKIKNDATTSELRKIADFYCHLAKD